MSDIFLREIARDDVATINRWRADQVLVGQLGAPFRFVGLATDEQWFDRYLASRANNVRLAICLADGRLVGTAYLLNIDWIHRNAEFAIWIGEQAQLGKKIGTTATRLMLEHAFSDLNLERLYLTVLTRNERALRLYRGVGFVAEGVQRHAVFKQGRYEDLSMMALLRTDYAASKAEP